MGSVFLDTNEGVPASERFKMAFENVTDRQVYVATSSDGFAWTPVGQPAITVPGFAGECNSPQLARQWTRAVASLQYL